MSRFLRCLFVGVGLPAIPALASILIDLNSSAQEINRFMSLLKELKANVVALLDTEELSTDCSAANNVESEILNRKISWNIRGGDNLCTLAAESQQSIASFNEGNPTCFVVKVILKENYNNVVKNVSVAYKINRDPPGFFEGWNSVDLSPGESVVVVGTEVSVWRVGHEGNVYQSMTDEYSGEFVILDEIKWSSWNNKKFVEQFQENFCPSALYYKS